MPTLPARNPTGSFRYRGNWDYEDRFDWYSQRDSISGNAALQLMTPIRLRIAGAGSPERIYRNFAPILVTVDVSVQVTNPGAGGIISFQVYPVWGGIQGSNTAFIIDSVPNEFRRIYTQLQVFTPPPAPSTLIIQWQVVSIPAGAVITINSDALSAGSHYYIRYLTNQLFGEARI